MLDIQKELEKFNRLLEEVDQTGDETEKPSPGDETVDRPVVEPQKSEMFARTEESDEHGPAIEDEQYEDEESVPATPPVFEYIPVSYNRTGSDAESASPPLDAPSTSSTDDDHHWTVIEHLHRKDVSPASIDDVADTDAVRELDEIGEASETLGSESRPEPASESASLFDPPSPAAFDSLMKGAKTALTDTHRPKPKATPPVTVTLPSVEELEEDVERDRGFREKIVPLFTSRIGTFRESMGVLEHRMGTVVSVAAAAVVIVAGLIIVPRMVSDGNGDSEALASTQAQSDSVHLLSSADEIPASNTATLSVSSYPPGARVYLGSELIGVTPFRGITVDRGLQSISIKKADYVSMDTMLTLDGQKDLFFELPADLTTTRDSRPDDLPREEAQSGSQGRQLQQASVADRSSVADNSAAEPNRESTTTARVSQESRRAAPPATGSVVITSDPVGATVFIADQMVGQTPLTLNEVTAGRTRVTMQHDGYVPYEIELNVMSSIQTPFHAVLAPMKGRIEVRAEGGADLYIDGVLVQRSIQPGYVEIVDVGDHTVGLVHPVYGEWSTSARVLPDETTPINVSLEDNAYDTALENGDRLFSESRYADAIEAYNRALEIRPGVAAIQNKIGLAAKGMSEPDVPSADASGIYSVVDTPPQLVGGLEALHASVRYPQEAYDAGVQGRVYIQFVVDEEGRARDLKVAKGLPMGCNDAAIRAVERSRFTPGLLGGRPVKVRHTVFVNFTIN